MGKKHTYYFALGDVDDNMDDLWNDEDNWGFALTNSAEWIYMIFSDTLITYDQFNTMVSVCKNNIIDMKSEVFEYPDDLEKCDIEDLIDYNDIIFEMQTIYTLSICRRIVPLIWGEDCWKDDENYDEDNPPSLWRMYIYDYEI